MGSDFLHTYSDSVRNFSLNATYLL